jgi:hypothetical protein
MSSTQAEVTRPAPAFANLAKAANFIIPVAIGVVLWFIPAPEGLNVKAWQMFAIFVATIAGIILAPLPMSAVALIGATVATLLGVIPFSAVVDATGTDLVWLVMLAFFISRGVIKSGLGRRIAPAVHAFARQTHNRPRLRSRLDRIDYSSGNAEHHCQGRRGHAADHPCDLGSARQRAQY